MPAASPSVASPRRSNRTRHGWRTSCLTSATTPSWLSAATRRATAGAPASTSRAVSAVRLTFPPDHYVTNRPKIDVTGRALRQGATVAVTVPPSASASVATDPAGTFRLAGAALTEGEWTIVATATGSGRSTNVEARVTADF